MNKHVRGPVFLGWNQPWVHVVADWLWANPDKLRRRLVVVPTRESGRHLREVLLERAIRDGSGAILGPRLATPDDFFLPAKAMPDVIRWAGWVQVLRTTDDDSVGTLFPGGIASKDDGWRLGVARQIEDARELLASINAGFGAVSAALPDEAERWSELASLEARVLHQWCKWGFVDPVTSKRETCRNPVLPHGVDEVILAGIPDPTRLSVEAWKQLVELGRTMVVLVAAPESLREAFDEWGRPKSGYWTNRAQHATPEPTESVLAADATGLAKAVGKACLGKTDRDVAIGVCDLTFMPAVSRCLNAAGWTTFDPQGVTLAKDGWPELLDALAEALEAPDKYAAIARVARHPVVWPSLVRDVRRSFAELEKWEKKSAASDTTWVITQLRNAKQPELQAAGRLLKRVHRLILGAQTGKAGVLEKRFRQWLHAFSPELLATAEAEITAWAHLDSEAFALPLRLRWLATTLSAINRPTNARGAHIALQGWLELLFDPAPHLILAGLHEGCVPEAPAPNPLISDVVRERLGLRDRKTRLAREVFLYTAMVEGRRQAGSVTVVTAQTNPQGEPCKPSRVMLQATTADLPQRVLACMTRAGHLPPEPTPPWSRGTWRLRVPDNAPRNKTWSHLSPSTLKTYLDCPTRFYFSKVLGWEEFESFDDELDAGGFGDLLHQVFRAWSADEEARELTDARKLKACWRGLLDQEVQCRFGSKLPPLMQLQVMSAAERLNALADHQVQQRRDGWRIIDSERPFKTDLVLAGIPIEMRVDRIDQNQDGLVRVVDYKTGRKGDAPRKTHLRTWPAASRPAALGPLFKPGKSDKCEYGWADLQLPLYALTVQKAMNLSVLPQAWYAVLPEAIGNTRFVQFEELEKGIDFAYQWAQEAVRRIVAGVFWPPAPEVKYDALQTIAPEGLEKALGPEWAEFLSGTQTEAPTRV